MFKKFFLSFVFMLSVLLVGCVTPSADGPELATVSSDSAPGGVVEGVDTEGYRLQKLDPILVRFNGIMEQQVLELVIDSQGEISLLHLKNPVKAAGLTTSELEEAIEKAYLDGKIYKHLSVNVTMTAKIYYVQGEVNAPGQFQLVTGTTLMQAIASARGYTSFANKKKIKISRQGQTFVVNGKELEKDPSKDQKIRAGDVIHVPEQWY